MTERRISLSGLIATRFETEAVRTRGYRRLTLLIAIAYGTILAALPLDVFKDRHNYLEYAANSWEILQRYWSKGLLATLTNEPFWLFLNAGLGAFFSTETVLRIIIGLPATIVAYQVLRRGPAHFIWLLFFLLMPQVLKNHIIHLRQGVGISLFLLGYFSTKRWRWFCLALTPFIHASFFFVLALLGVNWLLVRMRLAFDLRSLASLGLGIATGLSLSTVASLLGARQAMQYNFSVSDVSGLGFLFWLAVFVIFRLEGRRFTHYYSFATGAMLFYLGTYFLIETTARIFESSILIVLLSGLGLTGWRRATFLCGLIIYTLLSYGIRISQPWLGFGLLGS